MVLLATGAAGTLLYLDQVDDESEPTDALPSDIETTEGEPGDGPFADVLVATEEAGDAAVETRLRIRMPPRLDDGVPQRRIAGSGALAADLSEARIDYEMSEVPNSAGYFGHVDGELAVAYSDTAMITSFPALADSLSDRGDWLSYELPFLSTDYLLNLGVGQLRELALSDPRIGIALLEGTVGELDTGEEAEIDGEEVTEYEIRAGVPEAADAVNALEPLLTELWDGLLIRFVPMTVSVDGDDRIRRLEYAMEFPARRGPGRVRLNVRHDLTEFGVPEGPEIPAETDIVTHEDFFLSPSPTASPAATPTATPTS